MEVTYPFILGGEMLEGYQDDDPVMAQAAIDSARHNAILIERKLIRARIMERITDLRACGKSNDNCAEFAHYIESYLEEWLDDEL